MERADPSSFPNPWYISPKNSFKTDGHEAFLHLICDVAADKGNTYFVFDRGSTAKISECCRLSFKLDDQDLLDAKEPWRMRYSALQNVTVNLPRLGYTSKGDDTLLFDKIDDLMHLAIKAHSEKKAFIEKLISHGDRSPLSLLTMNKDGAPYLRMHRVTYLIGMLGLNELVHIHTGEELHESNRAFKFGLKVISHMDLLTKRLSKEHGMRFVLEQTPAESTAYRFARLDLKYHSPEAEHYVKGDLDRGEAYYTNSNLFCSFPPR